MGLPGAASPSRMRDWDAFDAMMTRYDPDRARSHTRVLDVVEQRVGTPRVLVDIGCGTGALLASARTRWPGTRLLGVDDDPVVIAFACGRPAALEVHDLDVVRPDWTSSLPAGDVDAVVSTTSLHDVPEVAVPTLAREVARLLRPGGVFVDWDAFFSPEPPCPAVQAPSVNGPTWQSWWEDLRCAAVDEPQLSALLRERDERRSRPRATGDGPTSLMVWASALSAAGVADAEVVHRCGDHCLLVATRGGSRG